MTKKEQMKMARLEAENAEFRDAIKKHMRIYAETLSELVTVKSRLHVIECAVNEADQ